MNSDLKTLETIVEYCTKIENATMRFGNNQKEFLSDIDYQHTCSFSINSDRRTGKTPIQRNKRKNP